MGGDGLLRWTRRNVLPTDFRAGRRRSRRTRAFERTRGLVAPVQSALAADWDELRRDVADVADNLRQTELPGALRLPTAPFLEAHGIAPWASRRARPAVPIWAVALAVAGGVAIGVGVGMALTRGRTARRVRRLEAAADEIKAAWPEVTDTDIQQARGSAARLAGVIEARTGASADAVRDRITAMTSQADSPAGEQS